MVVARTLVAVVAALLQIPQANANASGLRASPTSTEVIDTKLADTVRALDSNGNGKVDQAELTTFAKSQGLSSQEVLADFKELDVNNDNALDSSEIGPLFGATDSAETSASTETAEKPVAAAAKSRAAAPPAEKLVATAAEAPVAALPPQSETQKVVPDAAAAGNPEPIPIEELEAAVAVKPALRKKDSMGLDLAALEHDAQQQAGGIIASRLAQRAQVLLARSSADENKAQAFDAEVRTLRGNATALAQKASKETREAARVASASVSEKSLTALKRLQEDEHKSEVAAAERRQRAQEAMERVRKAQASLRSS